MMINLKLTPELYGNLRILVTAGAKSPQTGEEAIMAAAQLLQLMHAAYQEASHEASGPKKANGHDVAEAVPVETN